ncbi:hypothetical protein FFI94_017915 [Rhodococcus sp. KBS0724]|jgi:Flp pilus assembly protein TadB|uniref:hypothetical protein n=1 Tax=Rhodococcus sp. KBS0724 TaxID=1179674 RepID=UPI00110F3030|nr:hypothetical protein [Rhodococcus sp. KBS0724]TSD47820.1 hypothetical protein FFI94_017915 [Rhodococcus sp. KBS0724]
MTTAGFDTRVSRRTTDNSVDIAGTLWPLYKLEALAIGLIVFVAILAITTSMQPAVLTAAAAAVVTWWVRRNYYSRS